MWIIVAVEMRLAQKCVLTPVPKEPLLGARMLVKAHKGEGVFVQGLKFVVNASGLL